MFDISRENQYALIVAKLLFWLQKVAESGDVSAQFQLANYYKRKDIEKARYWFEKCAEQRDKMKGMFEPRKASTELGLMYMKGKGVGRNDKIAFEHFNNALGHSVAMYYVGKYYEKGEIVQENLIKAYENYENSYNKGYKPAKRAMHRIGRLLSK